MGFTPAVSERHWAQHPRTALPVGMQAETRESASTRRRRVGFGACLGAGLVLTVVMVIAAQAERLPPLRCALDRLSLSDDFDSVAGWCAQPGWLAAPSDAAHIAHAAGIACFTVPERNRGMKWSRAIPAVSLDEMPYLVLRYRAESIRAEGDDYCIYLGGPRGDASCHAVRLGDLDPDGAWHTVAVDASRLAEGEAIHTLAVQVRATTAGNARLWLDRLTFTDRLPTNALLLRADSETPAAPDWSWPLAATTWTAHSSWLANPATHHDTRHNETTTVWRVEDPGRGMKWSCPLPPNTTLSGHRYLVMHYRASNYSPAGDYALCLLGKAKAGGLDYRPVVANTDIVADNRWHTLSVALAPATAYLTDVSGLAIQVQADGIAPAELCVDRLALTDRRAPRMLSEYLDITPGADFTDFRACTLTGLCNNDANRFAARLRIDGSMPGPTLTAAGIPFALEPALMNVLASTFEGHDELALPVKAAANEVYLLLWAAMAGAEEPARGTGRLRQIADVDRFRIRLEYTEGPASECLPLNATTRRYEVNEGPQVLCASADPGRTIRRVVLCDRTSQGVFGIAGVTCRINGARRFGEPAEETLPMRIRDRPAVSKPSPHAATARVTAERAELSNAHLAVTLDLVPFPRIVGLVNQTTGHDAMAGHEAGPLLAVTAGALRPLGTPVVTQTTDCATLSCEYDCVEAPELQCTLRFILDNGNELACELELRNAGTTPVETGFAGPCAGPFVLGNALDANVYLLPKRGAALHNAPCDYHERYCGHDMPLQFVTVVNPAAGEGLHLRTEDRDDTWRYYTLRKDTQGVRFGVDYPVRALQPGGTRRASRTLIGVGNGDWRDGFEAYRRWLRTWYRPAAPRQRWFRETFNFRQRFLWSHDPLYDRATGDLHLERAITEASHAFGGIEYLHLFDWGYCGAYGRIYGRTGDYSPYDYLAGGQQALRHAIAAVQSDGVPVGLYIEGYLLEERGRLGQAHGREWQLVRADGQRAYWPDSTEMMICPWIPAWRDVQASTYAARVRELNVNGMYVDQFGFANAGKDCYSPAHGHPVPGYAVLAERDYMRQLRECVDAAHEGVVLYGEECPCDVNSQFQDGSFTYAMNAAARTTTLVPLNLMRFAIPSFKTFEILVCDKPTGTWVGGVESIFFNGEGIWLEGPADEWFAPEALAAIRKCHAILRKYCNAFTCDAPTPLVPTEADGVFANRFPARHEDVYTLYNARYQTFSGGVLRVPHEAGVSGYDAWNACPLKPQRDGPFDILNTTIAPRGVGCLVVTHPPHPAHEQ